MGRLSESGLPRAVAVLLHIELERRVLPVCNTDDFQQPQSWTSRVTESEHTSDSVIVPDISLLMPMESALQSIEYGLRFCQLLLILSTVPNFAYVLPGVNKHSS